MFAKVNWKRVAVTTIGVFALTFIASAAKLPSAIGVHDWTTARDLAVAGSFAGLAAVVEAVFHAVSDGFGDPTAAKR